MSNNIYHQQSWFNDTNQIALICKPLFSISPIKAFQYQRIYHNGSRTILCSNAELILHTYINANAKIKRLYTPKLIVPSERYSLTATWAENISNLDLAKTIKTQLSEEKELFGLKDEFIIRQIKPKFLEAFVFFAPEDTSHAKSFYINNLQILEQFCLYFLDKAKPLIETADKDRAVKAWRQEKSDLIFIDEANTHLTLEQLGIPLAEPKLSIPNMLPQKLYFQALGIENYITQKELLCLLQVTQGKSNADIANNLHISKRTVETHFNSLRNKTNTANRYELINFFTSRGLSRLQSNIIN